MHKSSKGSRGVATREEKRRREVRVRNWELGLGVRIQESGQGSGQS
jgi:hypothetical protein